MPWSGLTFRAICPVLKGEETHNILDWEFPGRPVLKTPGFHRGMGSIPGWGKSCHCELAKNPGLLLKWLVRRRFELVVAMPCAKLTDATLPLCLTFLNCTVLKNAPCLSKQVDCANLHLGNAKCKGKKSESLNLNPASSTWEILAGNLSVSSTKNSAKFTCLLWEFR